VREYVLEGMCERVCVRECVWEGLCGRVCARGYC